MNIKRFINQNGKVIWYVIIIIGFVLFGIKSLNSYYEEYERKKKSENYTVKNNVSNTIQSTDISDTIEQNDTVENTMKTFVNYCNNKQIQKAYNMLTDECKQAMYTTVEKFEENYVQNVFNEKKEYSMIKWANDGDILTYKVNFSGDILATGGEGSISQEYYTFIKDEYSYKINVNDYIYGKSINKEYKKSGISVNIKNINIYDGYEQYEISFTNNTSKEISLTGNKYVKNIYLKNSKGTTYSSINSKFDTDTITLKPGNTKSYIIDFNKVYNPQNKVNTLVLSDVILDYEEYSKVEDKKEYTNRTSIEIEF